MWTEAKTISRMDYLFNWTRSDMMSIFLAFSTLTFLGLTATWAGMLLKERLDSVEESHINWSETKLGKCLQFLGYYFCTYFVMCCLMMLILVITGNTDLSEDSRTTLISTMLLVSVLPATYLYQRKRLWQTSTTSNTWAQWVWALGDW